MGVRYTIVNRLFYSLAVYGQDKFQKKVKVNPFDDILWLSAGYASASPPAYNHLELKFKERGRRVRMSAGYFQSGGTRST